MPYLRVFGMVAVWGTVLPGACWVDAAVHPYTVLLMPRLPMFRSAQSGQAACLRSASLVGEAGLV